jgi:curved DNA-binding protein CbpA
MTGPKSLYDVLEVAPDADQGAIEAAYRALIKKYHPDRLAAAGGGDQQRAAEINEAYTVLRDPAKRAAHDEALRKFQEAALKPVVYRPVPPPPRSRFGIKAFLAVIILVGGAVYAILSFSPPSRRPAPPPVVEQNSQPDPATLDRARFAAADLPVRQAVDRTDVVRAIATFTRIEPSGMSAVADYSVACFRRQQDSQRIEDFDFCVAFDEAASTFESLSIDPERTLTSRFAPHVLSVRHINAARLLGDDHGWINVRLAEIRGMANAALAEALDSARAEEEAARAAEPETASSSAPVPHRLSQRPQRPARPRGGRTRAKPRPAEGDFLEREGYIY